jgi:large conductance mechanosensitive channel
MIKGFRDFILRGNVVDLAVAVVIGAAFTGIVNSLVSDIINPLLAAIVKRPDFSSLVLNINGGHIKYGNFMNAIIQFVLVAGAVYFLVVVPVSRLLKKLNPPGPSAPSTKPCPECLSEIPLAAKRCSHCTQLLTT